MLRILHNTKIDFIRLWIKALGIAERDQFYVVAHMDGAPIALVPLQRRWDKGARVLSWFPGPHVGCNAPVVDIARLQTLSSDERRRLWIKLLRSFRGADVVYMKAVPQLVVDGIDLFAEMGQILKAALVKYLDELIAQPIDRLLEKRYEKHRKIGYFMESETQKLVASGVPSLGK